MRKSGPAAGESETARAGTIPGLPGEPAFTLRRSVRGAVPVLVSVPHAGRLYPPQLRQAMRAPALAAMRLEDRLIDVIAEQVAQRTGATLIVARAPRAMIDLNRAADDVDWGMVAGGAPAAACARRAAGRRAATGLGLVPRRLMGLGEIWKRPLAPEELAARIDQIHAPYHRAIAAELARLRDVWGAALLVDLHSMPPLGAKEGDDPAADIVLGDRFGASCGAALVHGAVAALDAAGVRVAVNRPYAGGHVLDRHGAPARALHALQIEVCRAAYLDEALVDLGKGSARIADVLADLVAALAAQIESGAIRPAIAAE